MIKTAVETEVIYRNRNIYKKSSAERMKLKAIKQNLTNPFVNETIIHFSTDSLPTELVRKIQPTEIQKRERKYGTKSSRNKK